MKERRSDNGVSGELARSSMMKALEETLPQELLGVVEDGCVEPRDSDLEANEPERGSNEKVLVPELTLIILLGRLEDGGRGDEARLVLTLMLSESGLCREAAFVSLDEGDGEVSCLIHDGGPCSSISWSTA